LFVFSVSPFNSDALLFRVRKGRVRVSKIMEPHSKFAK
jgi:hypothetical protein